MSSRELLVYTDGACFPNPGRGSWGVVIIESTGEVRKLSGAAEGQTTSSRMEMTAILMALRAIIESWDPMRMRRVWPSPGDGLTGIVLAIVPGLPTVELAPELVLLLVLPPVIYSSAVAMSWREFRFNLRPISLLAAGGVAFTTVAIAAATHWLLGLAWPVGFVLSAIVSPPHALAPLAIAKMQLPRRILFILEGEGLANDATALILYRFAEAAVSIGVFSFGQALGMFAAIVVATDERFTDKDGQKQERTEWHSIVAFGRLGEICGEYLKKGRQVFVEGRLRTREYESKNGDGKRRRTEFIASRVQFLGAPPAEQADTAEVDIPASLVEDVPF